MITLTGISISTLINSIPSPITLTSFPEEKIIFVNDFWCQETGYSRDEVVGHPVSELVSFKDPAQRMLLDEGSATQETVVIPNVRFLSKEGENKNYQVSSVLITVDGQPCVLASYQNMSESPQSQDMTNQQKVRQDLAESEEQFRKLTENAHAGVYIVKNGVFTYVNSAFARMVGYDPLEMVGVDVFRFVHPDDHAHVAGMIQGSLSGEIQNRHYEIRAVRKNKDLIYCEIFGTIIALNNQPVLIATVLDITDWKRAELNLKERVKELNTLFNLTEISRKKEISLDEFYQAAVNILPGGWQYPEIACARLAIHDRVFQTKNFEDPAWRQSAAIIVNGTAVGILEVGYLAEKPTADEGPFLKTERSVLDVFAHRLGQFAERKLLDQKLEESEDRFRTVFMTGADAFVIVGRDDGRIIEVNDRMVELYGFTRDEMIGRTSHELEMWVYPEARQKMLDQLSTYGRVQNLEVYARRKGGECFWVLYSVNELNAAGKSLILGVIHDITELKRNAEAMRQSEEKFRLAFMTALDAYIWTTLEDGRIHEINPVFEEIYGYSREEVIGHTTLELNLFSDPADRARMVSELNLKGFIKDFELKGMRKDGKIIIISLSTNQIRVNDQDFILGVIRDITQSKQARDAVQKRGQLLLALHEVTLEMSAEKRLPVLFTIIMKHAQSLLDADRGGGIYLLDASQNVVRLAYGTGINQDRDGITLRLDQGVAGQVVRTSQPLIVDDYTHWEERATLLVSNPPSTVMGVPLLLDGKATGALLLVANSALRKFTEQDVQQAELFASQAAIALENARLYEAVEKELDERKHKEEELRESELRFRTLIEGAPFPMIVSRTGISLLVNKKAAELLGFQSVAEAVGRPIFEFFPPHIQEESKERTRRRALGLPVPEEFEFVLRRKDGSQFPIQVFVKPIQLSDGTANMSFISDITEVKKRQAEIQNSLLKLRQSVEGTIETIASIVEVRDPYTSGHQKGVARISVEIAEEMGLPKEQITGIYYAGLIYDLGKIQVPAEILSKPGKLTGLELEMVKIHPQVGYELLKRIEFPWPIAEIVHQHQERVDGSGYPRNLKGDQITIEAKIIGVADVVDAMTSHRPYRPALGLNAALAEIESKKGILYDPSVVDACLKVFGSTLIRGR